MSGSPSKSKQGNIRRFLSCFAHAKQLFLFLADVRVCVRRVRVRVHVRSARARLVRGT